VSKEAEYQSLRQELLEHQSRRLPILEMALGASAALFAAGLQLSNPYLPLIALFLLHSARVQIAQAVYGVQRIATYLRIMHEADDPQLNWETASYEVRRATQNEQAASRGLWNIAPILPMDNLILLASLAALALALGITLAPVFELVFPINLGPSLATFVSPVPASAGLTGTVDASEPVNLVGLGLNLAITLLIAVIWLFDWMRYNRHMQALTTTQVDEAEAEFWREFKSRRSLQITGETNPTEYLVKERK
jgi:hypothetical protein